MRHLKTFFAASAFGGGEGGEGAINFPVFFATTLSALTSGGRGYIRTLFFFCPSSVHPNPST
jgi:hypothetical protein